MTRILLALTATCALGACCSDPKPLLAELNWSTPERAVETYRKAFSAEKAAAYEFECLSDALKDRYGIGLMQYELGRRKFLDANGPVIERLKSARVSEIREVPDSDPPRVIVRVQEGEDVAEFELINEPVAWIKFTDEGDDITMDVRLKSIVDVLTTSQDGKRLIVDGLPEPAGPLPPISAIHELRITNRWRLLQIAGLSTSLQQALEQAGLNEQATDKR